MRPATDNVRGHTAVSGGDRGQRGQQPVRPVERRHGDDTGRVGGKTVTFASAGDATIDQTNATKNFGTDTKLVVDAVRLTTSC